MNLPNTGSILPISLKVYKVSGGHSDGDPPNPIPNLEVKPICANGTARVTVWESRSLPEFFKKGSTVANVAGEPFFICKGLTKMVPPDSRRVVHFVAEAAYRRLAAQRVILFGSRARGDHRRNSDYDFAVLPDEALAGPEAWLRFLVYLDEEAPTLSKLDVINLAGPLDVGLRAAIEATGLVIGRSP